MRPTQAAGLAFSRQVNIAVQYKCESVGESRLDLLVGGKLIVELKAVEELAPIHKAQVNSYLRMTGRTLALLINSNTRVLKEGIRRIILSQ